MPKKNSTLQLYMDFWGHNLIMMKSQYPQPLMSEVINCLAGACYLFFSKLDI
jgi:hypothetical protein